MSGKVLADDIARECLFGARAAAMSAVHAARTDDSVVADVPLRQRLNRLDDAMAIFVGPGVPNARSLGLPVFRLVRHAVADLRSSSPEGHTRDRLETVHDEIDAVVTALGGIPHLMTDPDDWSLPEDDDGAAVPHALSDTAGTAAIIARDCVAALRGGYGTGVMRRDAHALLAACMAIRLALSSPDGAPAGLVMPVARGATDALDRMDGASASWTRAGASSPAPTVLRDIADLGRFAREVLADIEPEASAPAPC